MTDTTFLGFLVAGTSEIEDVYEEFNAITKGGFREDDEEDWQFFRLVYDLVPDWMGEGKLEAKLTSHRRRYRNTPFKTMFRQTLGVEIPTRNIRVNGTPAKFDTSFTVDSGGAFTVDEGIYFTIGNHEKVYQAASTIDNASSGQLHIYPKLRTAIPNNALLNFAPQAKVKYSPGTIRRIRWTRGSLYAPTVTLDEDLKSIT